MGLYFTENIPHPLPIKGGPNNKRGSRGLSLKRLTPANRNYLISLEFKVKKNYVYRNLSR